MNKCMDDDGIGIAIGSYAIIAVLGLTIYGCLSSIQHSELPNEQASDMEYVAKVGDSIRPVLDNGGRRMNTYLYYSGASEGKALVTESRAWSHKAYLFPVGSTIAIHKVSYTITQVSDMSVTLEKNIATTPN